MKSLNKDLFLQKQIDFDNKIQNGFYIKAGSFHQRRSSQDSKMPKLPKQSFDLSVPKHRPSKSVHVDQEIQTNQKSSGLFQWKKITQKVPKRVLLNYKEIVKPKEIELNFSQPRIHSPSQNSRFQKSFYLNYIESKITNRRPQLNLTNSLVQIQDTTTEFQTHKIQRPYRYNYIFHYVIGSGGFGKVWKVESKKSRIIYAMKVLSKAKVLAKKSVKSIMNEKTLLNRLKHPFIVNMVASFQDRDNLYLVMDYLSGGDMRYHIMSNKIFREEQIKFLMACLILGLEYMHLNNIIHRDIKPENLVLDCKGYLRITDLGIARMFRNDNANETSGTPGYMAPEILMKQNHSFQVDYFALGVITYEMMTGKRPYMGRSRKEIREEVLVRQVQLNQKDYLQYSTQLIEFTNKLIQRKPSQRLGATGIQELKQHALFDKFQWDKLYNKSLIAPYQPRQDDRSRLIKLDDDSQNSEINEQYRQLKLKEIQNLFNGYTYYSESTKQ